MLVVGQMGSDNKNSVVVTHRHIKKNRLQGVIKSETCVLLNFIYDWDEQVGNNQRKIERFSVKLAEKHSCIVDSSMHTCKIITY